MNPHAPFIRRCLSLAEKGRGFVGNGALVGSVLVRNGAIIAEAFHAGFGKPHAERALLHSEGKILPDDILYVNLEPCCHHGKTPPCTDIILESGVRNVIYGMRDPDERVRGRGIKELEKAKISVIGPVLQQECERLNRGFVLVRTKQRPWITLKNARTIDGKHCKEGGGFVKITSKQQDEWSHRFLRARHDAILVGSGTIFHDDSRLTTRYMQNPPPSYRIILDPHLCLSLDAHAVTDEFHTRTIVVYCSKSSGVETSKIPLLEKRGVSILSLDMREGRFDWTKLWHLLTTPDADFHGITSILVEGGLRTWQLFRQAKLMDEEVTLVGGA